MRSGGCWSSVVASAQERSALHLTPRHDWLVACVLPAGHDGAHGSDGAQNHEGRRHWLLWGDYARGAQNLAVEFECSAEALDGAPCMFFGGHGGPHRFAAPVGEDFPPAQPAPTVPPQAAGDRGRHEMTPKPAQPATVPPPPWMPGGRRAKPEPEGVEHVVAPPPPDDESVSLSSLDALFAGMPSLKNLPRTDVLEFPEGSFQAARPDWPESRGDYVAQHHAAAPVEPEVMVSGPDRFESPADESAGQVSDDEIIDVEEVPDPAVGGLGGRRRAAPTSGRHGSGEEAPKDSDARDSRWLEVRPGAASVLTTPMVEVISSNGDPVRMGVPTARRRLPDDGDLTAVTAAVEDAAVRLQRVTDTDGEVSAALQDVGDALARLSEVLRSR